jgi:hypothetical protein
MSLTKKYINENIEIFNQVNELVEDYLDETIFNTIKDENGECPNCSTPLYECIQDLNDFCYVCPNCNTNF